MEKLPWIAEVRHRENSDYPYMAYAVHRETGARVHEGDYLLRENACHSARVFAGRLDRIFPTGKQLETSPSRGEIVAQFELRKHEESDCDFNDFAEVSVDVNPSIDAITVESLAAVGFTCCGSPVWYRKRQLLIRLGPFSITAHISQGEGDCEIGKVRSMDDILILDRIVSGNTPDNKDR